MGGNHSRITGMKLAIEPFLFEPVPDGMDPLGDHQHGTRMLLGDGMAQRPPDRTSHPHNLALFVNQSELSVDRSNLLGITRGDTSRRLIGRHIQKQVSRRIDQVDRSFDQLNILHHETFESSINFPNQSGLFRQNFPNRPQTSTTVQLGILAGQFV